MVEPDTDLDSLEPDYTDLVTYNDSMASEDDLFLKSANFEKLGDTNSGVPGRLLGKHLFYLEVDASQYIIDTIQDGYKLVFENNSPPPESFLPNNKSALDRSSFVLEELLRLESLGCIKSVPSRPHIVNPLSCVFSKKWRVVLDASRGLNPYCLKRKIVLDDLRSVSNVVKEGDFMTVSDHDSGYWHVPINVSHQQYLGLHFVHPNGNVSYWQWVCMPLGIVDAAFIYTKITKPIMAHLRSQGCRTTIYIDDLLNCHQSFQGCLDQEKHVHRTFFKGGWVFKPEKSSGPPSQQVKYLGLIINSATMCFEIPPDKFVCLLEEASFFLDTKTNKLFPVKKLASWVGKLQSLRLAIGPVVSIMCRFIYRDISDAKTWFSYIRLSKDALTEIRWWFDNLVDFQKYPIIIQDSSIKTDFQTSSDASGLGFFAISLGDNSKLISAPFTESQSKKSSTWRELFAVHQVWTDTDICSRFEGLTVKHFTDSKSVANILFKGSNILNLNVMVKEIFMSLRSHCIRLFPVWVRRDHTFIELCDRGSREFLGDDFGLTRETLDFVLPHFPVVTCDGMASSTNAIVPRFYSKFSSLNALGVDFFAQTLSYLDFYFVLPPIRLLVSVTRFLALQQARGLLVLPLWPSANWFNFFFPDGVHTKLWVKKLLVFEPSFHTNLKTSTCFSGQVTFRAVALEFDFRAFPLSSGINLCCKVC